MKSLFIVLLILDAVMTLLFFRGARRCYQMFTATHTDESQENLVRWSFLVLMGAILEACFVYEFLTV